MGLKKQQVQKNGMKLWKKFKAPFYGWGSTASRLESLWGGSLLYYIKFPEIPGTHFINLGRMKGCVDLGGFDPTVLSMRPLDWESSTLTTRPLRLPPTFPKCWIEKKSNTVCSSTNLPSNLVNNIFASVHCLGFNIKLLSFFTLNYRSFPEFVSKSSEHC